jgi:hypothetical protein
MLYDPALEEVSKTAEVPKISTTVVTRTGKLRKRRKRDLKSNLRLFERWVRFKQYVMLKSRKKTGAPDPGKSERKFTLFGFSLW